MLPPLSQPFPIKNPPPPPRNAIKLTFSPWLKLYTINRSGQTFVPTALCIILQYLLHLTSILYCAWSPLPPPPLCLRLLFQSRLMTFSLRLHRKKTKTKQANKLTVMRSMVKATSWGSATSRSRGLEPSPPLPPSGTVDNAFAGDDLEGLVYGQDESVPDTNFSRQLERYRQWVRPGRFCYKLPEYNYIF